jgi:hypothetical protein
VFSNNFKQKEGLDFLVDPIMEIVVFDPALGPFILWVLFFVYLFFPTKKAFNG